MLYLFTKVNFLGINQKNIQTTEFQYYLLLYSVKRTCRGKLGLPTLFISCVGTSGFAVSSEGPPYFNNLKDDYVYIYVFVWFNHNVAKEEENRPSLSSKYEIVKLNSGTENDTVGKRPHLRGLVQSSLSTIFKNRTKIKEDYKSCGNPGRKRKRSGKNSQLDGALKGWFRTARQRDIPVPISCPILQEKASDYAKQINVSSFNASNGWLTRFKTRENTAGWEERCRHRWFPMFCQR